MDLLHLLDDDFGIRVDNEMTDSELMRDVHRVDEREIFSLVYGFASDLKAVFKHDHCFIIAFTD